MHHAALKGTIILWKNYTKKKKRKKKKKKKKKFKRYIKMKHLCLNTNVFRKGRCEKVKRFNNKDIVGRRKFYQIVFQISAHT